MFEFILTSEKQDIQKTGYISTNNYKFSNQIWFKNFIFGFYVPDFLKTSTFYLVKLTVNQNTGALSYSSFATIDNTYKIDNYFEAHEIADSRDYLEPGFYAIQTTAPSGDTHTTSSIFEVKNKLYTGTSEVVEDFTDGTEEAFTDNTGEAFEGVLS